MFMVVLLYVYDHKRHVLIIFFLKKNRAMQLDVLIKGNCLEIRKYGGIPTVELSVQIHFVDKIREKVRNSIREGWSEEH